VGGQGLNFSAPFCTGAAWGKTFIEPTAGFKNICLYNLSFKFMKKGIVVGSDHNQEWLLSWWWNITRGITHFSKRL